MIPAIQLIRSSPLGTRMTVRRRIDGGFSDALGYLRQVTETECVVETRRGLITITLFQVTAAKLVPPPPPPRPSTLV
ncbi:MAG: ferrous iron transport protein A [Terrimesophilobacter sp.]